MYTLFDLETAPPAPHGVVEDTTGRPVELSALWSNAALTALVFTRHFGCVFCRLQVIDLAQHQAQLADAGLQVLVIGPAGAADARWFAERFKPPFPVTGDPSGDVYAAFGLSDGAGTELFSPRIVADAARAATRGALPGRPRGRSKQLPGLMLVDRAGRLRLRQVAANAADHLRAEELLGAVEQLRRQDLASAERQ
jgi:peroxiredoxin